MEILINLLFITNTWYMQHSTTARVGIVYLVVKEQTDIRSRTTLIVVGFFTTEKGLAL